MEEYLRCTDIFDYDVELVSEKAQIITESKQTDKEKAVALFYSVRDEIRYNLYALGELREYNKASVVLERGNGFCFQKAILLVAQARSLGIPARLRFADIRNHRMPNRAARRYSWN